MFLLWLRQLPWCGDWTLASVPQPDEGRCSPTNTPVFLPISFILWSFVSLYIFFSIGQVDSCPLSAGVLHTLLCLKVYSWCICGERCTSHPPTPPPSCSPRAFFKMPFLPKELSTFSSLGYWKVHRVKSFGTAARWTVAVHHNEGILGDKIRSPVDTTE